MTHLKLPEEQRARVVGCFLSKARVIKIQAGSRGTAIASGRALPWQEARRRPQLRPRVRPSRGSASAGGGRATPVATPGEESGVGSLACGRASGTQVNHRSLTHPTAGRPGPPPLPQPGLGRSGWHRHLNREWNQFYLRELSKVFCQNLEYLVGGVAQW